MSRENEAIWESFKVADAEPPVRVRVALEVLKALPESTIETDVCRSAALKVLAEFMDPAETTTTI